MTSATNSNHTTVCQVMLSKIQPFLSTHTKVWSRLKPFIFFFLYCNGVLFRALKKGSCCPISGYLGSHCNGNSLFPLFLSLAPHSAVLHTAPPLPPRSRQSTTNPRHHFYFSSKNWLLPSRCSLPLPSTFVL